MKKAGFRLLSRAGCPVESETGIHQSAWRSTMKSNVSIMTVTDEYVKRLQAECEQVKR